MHIYIYRFTKSYQMDAFTYIVLDLYFTTQRYFSRPPTNHTMLLPSAPAPLILQFVAFMQRSIAHFQPTVCVLVYKDRPAADHVHHLLLAQKTNVRTWLCVNMSPLAGNHGSVQDTVRMATYDPRAIVVTLLSAAELAAFVLNSNNVHSRSVKHMFVLSSSSSSSYRTDALLSATLKRQHINGCLVLLANDGRAPVRVQLWNGCGAFGESNFRREPLLNESQLFDDATASTTTTTATAIYNNRLRHLSAADPIFVTTLMDPPGVLLLDDGTGDYRRLAGADISLMVHVLERLRVADNWTLSVLTHGPSHLDASDEYDRLLRRVHTVRVRSRRWHRTGSDDFETVQHFEYACGMALFEDVHECTTPYKQMVYKVLVSGVPLNGGRRPDGTGALHAQGLAVWLTATGLFAAMRFAVQPARADRLVRCLFDTFARTLGTSATAASASASPSSSTAANEEGIYE